MRPMARVERFFERLVERPTARVFRARLQPIQVLRRIEREMEGARQRSRNATIGPDRFVVRLAAEDLVALGAPDELAERLASGALAFARGRGLMLRTRPSVVIETDPEATRGDVEVSASFSAPVARNLDGDPMGAGGPGGPALTQVFQVPVAPTPPAGLEIAEPGRGVRRVTLAAQPTTLGRGSDCEVQLADAHASRHHARLDVRGGVLILTDLGSTNGTRVNGRRVREVVLGAGDRIDVGQTVIRVVEDSSPPWMADAPSPQA